MQLSLERSALQTYVESQMQNLFPDNLSWPKLDTSLDRALQRTEHCFTHIKHRYYNRFGQTYFDHTHTDQYATFLYFLSNTLFRDGADPRICQRVFALNKSLHAIDIFYEIELPEIFFLVHCVGSVLGRATYSNYLLVYQNCTVGANHGVYPVLGEYASLYTGAAVLGRCNIGRNCKIAVNSVILDRDLGPDEIYTGSPNNCGVKTSRGYPEFWFVDERLPPETVPG
jgi:serine O-acetyltransferase